MNTKHTAIYAALATTLGTLGLSVSAQAANNLINPGDTLTITAGVVSCVLGDCKNFGTDVVSGSFFGMDMNGSSSIQPGENTPLALGTQGLIIGTTQGPGSSSHNGCPYPNTDFPNLPPDTNQIDAPWCFFGNTGMDYTTKAVTQVGTDTGTKKFLDFSGWTVTWNSIGAIPMNARPWGAGTNFTNGGVGVAKIAWDGVYGDSYTLDYYATVPNNDPSGFGNVKYTLHMEGTVTAAPAPTTVADTASVGQNPLTVAIDVTANDTGTAPDKTTVAIGTAPTKGTTSIDPITGVITYAPNAGLVFTNGSTTDTFTYTVKNASGITSSQALVTVTIFNTAQPPIATNDAAITTENTAVPIDVTSNDSAPSGTIDKTTVAVTGGPSHGTTSVNGTTGVVTYTPTSGYAGSDSFTYTVNDNNDAVSNPATVSLTIYPTQPTAASGTLSGGSMGNPDGTASSVPADGALWNNFQCVGGCFDFQVNGLSGPSAIVVLPLTAGIPANGVYRKYANGAWHDFVQDANNAVASAQGGPAGTPVICPIPGSSDPTGKAGYRAGLNPTDRCVQLTIQDGGPNDAGSSTPDGAVLDPGGIGVVKVTYPSSTSSGGGCSISTVQVGSWQRGDWWVVAGFLAWLGAVRRKLSK